MLAVGTYTNEASIEGNEGTGTKTSNKVTAKVAAEPNFTIEKLQKIAGEASYTNTERTGKLGQTVEYKIVVKNTGNVRAQIRRPERHRLRRPHRRPARPNCAVGKEESFTCTHKLSAVGSYTNEASIEGDEGAGTKTSNKVVAKVTAEPNFTIEKQQRVNGESSYTSAERERPGRPDDGIQDHRQEHRQRARSNSAPSKTAAAKASRRPGATELAAGAEESFTCTHGLINTGTYSNEASIEGNEGTGTRVSNKVSVKVSTKAAYTITKEQRIKGESSYTTSELSGEVGQIVEYKIIVKNTGNVSILYGVAQRHRLLEHLPVGPDRTRARQRRDLHLHAHADLGRVLLQRSLDRSLRRRHRDLQQSRPSKSPRNRPSRSKSSRRSRAKAPTRRAEKSAEVGQSINYPIVVKNTGNMALKFSALKDSGCEGILPSSTTELAPGKEESFTCSHTLTTAGTYTNEASIEGNEGTGTKTSNKVTVKIAAKPAYTIEKLQRLERRKRLHQKRTLRQIRPEGRIQGDRQEHRQRDAQIRCPQRHRLRKHLARPAPPNWPTAKKRPSRANTRWRAPAATPTKPRSKTAKAPATRPPTKSRSTVNAEPNYSIEKFQRIGAEGYGNETRAVTVGQTVEYEIVVKNTGNVSLTFSGFADEHCDAGTLAGGPSGAVKPGESATYTCSHVITSSDQIERLLQQRSHRSPARKAPAPRNPTKSKSPSRRRAKTVPYEVDARWHYSAGGSPGNWSNTGDIVCGKQISFGPQAMEGEQRLKPGTEIKGGWDFKITDFHTTKWNVTFAEGRIIFRHVACEKGETPLKELLEIPLPKEVYNSVFINEWFPSGEQSNALVYQGKATIPAICGPHGENNVLLGKNYGGPPKAEAPGKAT